MKLSVSLSEHDVAVLDQFARASGLKSRSAADHLRRGVVTVVPVTSNISRVFAFQTLLPAELTGLRVDSKAQAEQIRSVAVGRVGPLEGQVPPELMAELDEAMRLHLGL
jgi:mRNA interferase MazF